MDPVSIALSTAWLDAVRRAQSESAQRLEEVAPHPRNERSLTQIIEGALKSGGMKPVNSKANLPPGIGRLLDKLA